MTIPCRYRWPTGAEQLVDGASGAVLLFFGARSVLGFRCYDSRAGKTHGAPWVQTPVSCCSTIPVARILCRFYCTSVPVLFVGVQLQQRLQGGSCNSISYLKVFIPACSSVATPGVFGFVVLPYYSSTLVLPCIDCCSVEDDIASRKRRSSDASLSIPEADRRLSATPDRVSVPGSTHSKRPPKPQQQLDGMAAPLSKTQNTMKAGEAVKPLAPNLSCGAAKPPSEAQAPAPTANAPTATAGAAPVAPSGVAHFAVLQQQQGAASPD